MIKTIKQAWHNTEIRGRMLLTLAVVLIFRLGCSIPVPFIQTQLFSAYIDSASDTVFGLLNMISGGAFSNATIFALGVQPYINASIIIQLLCVAIPALEKMAEKDRETGSKKIETINKIATGVIGLLQALGYYMLIRNYGMLTETGTKIWAAAIIILIFTLGSVAVMFLGKWVDKKGVGNGISILLFAGIVSRFPTMIADTIANVSAGSEPWYVAALLFIGMLILMALVVFINDADHKIPVFYAKRVIGRKMYGGSSNHIPVKVNLNGVMPIIFAQTIASLPATVAAFIGKTNSAWARTDNVWYAIAYTVLIFAFAYFYTSISFDTVQLANNLKNNGGTIPGFRPGKPTGEYLHSIVAKITFIGASCLALIAIVPVLLSCVTPYQMALSGTSGIIVIGVALDTIRNLEQKLVERNYSGVLVS